MRSLPSPTNLLATILSAAKTEPLKIGPVALPNDDVVLNVNPLVKLPLIREAS